MVLSLGFFIAGVCMLVARFLSDSSFLNLHSAWAAYDITAILFTAFGVLRLAMLLALIVKSRRTTKGI